MYQYKILLSILVILFISLTARAQQNGDYTDQIIVSFKGNARTRSDFKVQKERLISKLKGQFRFNLKELPNKNFDGSEVWKLDLMVETDLVEEMAEEISKSFLVSYSEPDRLLKAAFIPNDYYYWWQPLTYMGLESAWDQSTGSGVKIGIVDSGYRPHEDLNANYSLNADGTIEGRDFANVSGTGGPNFTDLGNTLGGRSWHGTQVSGVAAAVTNNGIGVAGVSHSSKIVPVRVTDQSGTGYTSAVANGISWASRRAVIGASRRRSRVVNVSLSSTSPAACPSTIQNAINFGSAYALIVVAAGNSNADAASYFPANCTNILVVGATDGYNSSRASFSNYGDVVKVVAPGTYIPTTSNTGWTTTPGADTYVSAHGTSFSAPLVSGVAALIASKYPSFDNAAIIRRILETGTTANGFNPSQYTTQPKLINAQNALDPERLFAYFLLGASYGVVTNIGSAPPTVLSFDISPNIPAGKPPYTYAWTVDDARLTITNPTSGTATISGTFSCNPSTGYPYSITTDGRVVVTDSLGNTSTALVHIYMDACFDPGGGAK